jgi:hypothetical protein
MAFWAAAKGQILLPMIDLRAFADNLTACVTQACAEIAKAISDYPEEAYGSSHVIAKGDDDDGGLAAMDFTTTVDAPHANAYARHFLSGRIGRTNRMDLGNLIEQRANELLQSGFPKWKVGQHYLYQQSLPSYPRFPVSFMGKSKSGRPDFRFELSTSAGDPSEAVFDITTPGEIGHVRSKTVSGGRTIGTCDEIPIAVEIFWQDSDIYKQPLQ